MQLINYIEETAPLDLSKQGMNLEESRRGISATFQAGHGMGPAPEVINRVQSLV